MQKVLLKQKNSKLSVKIALVSFDSLGDSLLYLLFAYNLKINQFNITCYSNVGFQLNSWIPKLEILPYPDLDKFEDELDSYDLVIMSPPRRLRDRMESDPAYLERLKNKYLLICHKAPKSWMVNQKQAFLSKIPKDLQEFFQFLINASSSIRHRDFGQESVVDIFCSFMNEQIGLDEVCRRIPLNVPSYLSFQKNSRRVIVSPDSAGPAEKNWGKQQFLSLCRKLKMAGFLPVIVVSRVS